MPEFPRGPALAAFELSSIAHGILVTDAMLKEARVHLAAATPSTPGRFFVTVWGDEAGIAYAHARGVSVAGHWRVDDLLLNVVDDQVVPALKGPVTPRRVDALGVVEMSSAVATVRIADAMAKATGIELMELVVSRGLAGKGFVTFTGSQADVDDALAVADDGGSMVARVAIPNPDAQLMKRVLAGEWGQFEGRRLY